eukprot:1064547-Pleurochrysis_carterae.AAC.4
MRKVEAAVSRLLATRSTPRFATLPPLPCCRPLFCALATAWPFGWVEPAESPRAWASALGSSSVGMIEMTAVERSLVTMRWMGVEPVQSVTDG